MPRFVPAAPLTLCDMSFFEPSVMGRGGGGGGGRHSNGNKKVCDVSAIKY